MSTRHVFFISDRTGITAESMGEALLSRFGDLDLVREVLPFIDTVDKARATVAHVNRCAQDSAHRPIIFSSIANAEIHAEIAKAQALHISYFATFVPLLEEEFARKASENPGNIHGITDHHRYDQRMEAVNFSLLHDDGISDRNLQKADVILVGVSRSGKTPTCLYLALQYGIRAANYPLTEEDLESGAMPRMLENFREKLYGLTIDPERLHHIRSERLPNSRYASLQNCRNEVRAAEALMRRHRIDFTTSTDKSVEELSTGIILANKLQRRT